MTAFLWIFSDDNGWAGIGVGLVLCVPLNLLFQSWLRKRYR